MGSQDTAETKHTILPVTKKIYLVQACSEKKNKNKNKNKQMKKQCFLGYLLNEDLKKWVVIKSVVFSSGSPLFSKIKPVSPKGNQP